jgi:hypothetical protein
MPSWKSSAAAALTAAGSALALAALGGTGAASAAPTATHALRTAQLTVRPVTADGHAAPGYTVKPRRHDGFALDCRDKDPSPSAVDAGIDECSPSAAYAVACWRGAGTKQALCLQDPTSDTLVRYRRSGGFAETPAVEPSKRAPLALVLHSGATCSIRDGGAWGQLKRHPNWYGTYSCSNGKVLYGTPRSHHYGVDERHPAWTVRVGPQAGNGDVVVRRVRRAYFVGTYAARR